MARITSHSPRRSPGRRAVLPLLIAAALCGALAQIYLRDSSPLTAAEDPGFPPAARDGTGAARPNGWSFLRGKLRDTPGIKPLLDHFRDMRHGSINWNDRTAAEAGRKGESLAWLEEAVAMPLFTATSTGEGSDSGAPDWSDLLFSVDADFALSLRRGDTERARRAALGMARLSLLLFRSDGDHLDFLKASVGQWIAVSEALELLSAGPAYPEWVNTLTEPWMEDPFTAEDHRHALLRYTLLDPEIIATTYPGHEGKNRVKLSGSDTLRGVIRYKPNRARRALLAAFRTMPAGMPEPAADMESSPGARLWHRWTYEPPSKLNDLLLFFHPNAEAADLVMPMWVTGIAYYDREVSRNALFLARAMRVTRAAMLWRLIHSGAPPAALADLVPAYLPEIPADPWTGAPLGWDAGREIITAVGQDWVMTPSASALKPGTVEISGDAAELRLPSYVPPP